VHDLLPHDSGERFRPTYRRLYTQVDALICHSEGVRSRLMTEFGVAEQKITVIPHGPFFYDLQGSGAGARCGCGNAAQRTVLWQGILQPYKGLDVLLESWRIVEGAESGARLVIAGTGDQHLLAGTRQILEQLHLRNVELDLRFLTAVELVDLYRRADLVVYPYRAITTSGALATGLALGKAIVASDLPVFREALEDGEDGVLVPPGDAEALAGAILRLVRDPDERNRMAARVKARAFGAGAWQEIARQTAEVYKELAG
jgi:glycosyltransferase involved in cell wall biosynthesis